MTPEELWDVVGESAGVSREEFDAYYDGAKQGVGIFVKSVHPVDEPFGLADLRRHWPEFHPPQGYRYLRSMVDHARLLLESIGWPSTGHETLQAA